MKKTLRKKLLLTLLAAATLSFLACGGSSIQGTYSNENGFITLDLKSGGKATMTMMGEAHSCTYKVNGQKLALECGQDKLDFTIHDDGSLTGPPGTFVGALKKSKS